ncbi:hypothetical protein QQ045_021648 [Rhodiola kirilowii]
MKLFFMFILLISLSNHLKAVNIGVILDPDSRTGKEVGIAVELAAENYNNDVETFDAIVGDVTILANRSQYVSFTQPYAESGLTMIVPVKIEAQTWMFTKPFTASMWMVTCAILIYTMFIVWFLEHHSNPAFRGPWKNQIGTATWFTFSTLFFAHSKPK